MRVLCLPPYVWQALSKDQKAKIATQTQASLQQVCARRPPVRGCAGSPVPRTPPPRPHPQTPGPPPPPPIPQPFGPDLSTLTVQLLADSACGLLRGGAAHLVADLAVLQEHLQVVPLSDWPALAAKVVGHLCEHFVSGADNTGYALMLYALRAAAHAGPFKGPSATDLAPISNRLGREQSYDARVVYLRLRRALGARDCETALAEELEELARTDQRRAYQTVRFLGLPVEEYARSAPPDARPHCVRRGTRGGGRGGSFQHLCTTAGEGAWGTWASRRRDRSAAGCGRPEGGGVCAAKSVERPPQQPAQPPIRQLLGTANEQTEPATSSTAPTHRPLGSANAETTPAGAPAAAADRTQRPDATCEGKNG